MCIIGFKNYTFRYVHTKSKYIQYMHLMFQTLNNKIHNKTLLIVNTIISTVIKIIFDEFSNQK